MTGEDISEIGALVSFEEMHLFLKKQDIVKSECETEALLIYLCHVGYLERQVFPETNTIWYRRTSMTKEDLEKSDGF